MMKGFDPAHLLTAVVIKTLFSYLNRHTLCSKTQEVKRARDLGDPVWDSLTRVLKEHRTFIAPLPPSVPARGR